MESTGVTETPDDSTRAKDLTTESLEKVAQMADEMEENYKEKIELLEIQRDDLLQITERLIVENERLLEEKDASKLCLYYAGTLLVFVYGMIYGVYMRRISGEEL